MLCSKFRTLSTFFYAVGMEVIYDKKRRWLFGNITQKEHLKAIHYKLSFSCTGNNLKLFL